VAGIGFALRELDRRESIFGSIASIGHGAVVAAGPWIFTVVALALIQHGSVDVLTSEASHNFQGLVVYAFALSLLVTAPIVNVSIRLVADDIYSGRFQNVRPRFLVALVACAGIAPFASILVYGALLRLSWADLLVAIVSTTVIGLIWPTLAFCGAVKDYRGITVGFSLGLLISVAATTFAAAQRLGELAMMVAFVSGLCLVFFWLAGRVLVSFPYRVSTLAPHLRDFANGLAEHWVLGIASFIAIAAIWADKWVMWTGPQALSLENGLVSAPTYDSAMFVAYLFIIPSLGMFVKSIETRFFEDFRHFLASIQDRAPLDRLNGLAEDLEKQTFRMIYRVLITQGTLCAIAIILSPVIIPLVGLQFEQIGILRLGIFAAFFQFMFITCSSIVLFFDRSLRFLALQLIFLAAQVGFTLVAMRLGPEYAGYGHLIACAASALIGVAVLEATMSKSVYLIFSAALRQRPRQLVAATVHAKKAAPQPAVVRPASAPSQEQAPSLETALAGPLLRP